MIGVVPEVEAAVGKAKEILAEAGGWVINHNPMPEGGWHTMFIFSTKDLDRHVWDFPYTRPRIEQIILELEKYAIAALDLGGGSWTRELLIYHPGPPPSHVFEDENGETLVTPITPRWIEIDLGDVYGIQLVAVSEQPVVADTDEAVQLKDDAWALYGELVENAKAKASDRRDVPDGEYLEVDTWYHLTVGSYDGRPVPNGKQLRARGEDQGYEVLALDSGITGFLIPGTQFDSPGVTTVYVRTQKNTTPEQMYTEMFPDVGGIDYFTVYETTLLTFVQGAVSATYAIQNFTMKLGKTGEKFFDAAGNVVDLSGAIVEAIGDLAEDLGDKDTMNLIVKVAAAGGLAFLAWKLFFPQYARSRALTRGEG